MLDFDYISALPELPASPTAGKSYKVTTKWEDSFDPGGKKLTVYILTTGTLKMADSGDRAMVKLRRTRNNNSASRQTVTLPICGARYLYDNGIAIAGFKWQPE